MKYENRVREICGDEWRTTEANERDGGYGVAIMVAYLNGARPTLDDMSRHLRVDIEEIEIAFRRLQANGVFLPDYDTRNDLAILEDNSVDPVEIRTAWATIAGQASGFVGQGYYLQREPELVQV
jgi:hypothetical protein